MQYRNRVSKKTRKMQRLVVYIICALLIFTAGVLVGKWSLKRGNAETVSMEEPSSVPVEEAGPVKIPSAQKKEKNTVSSNTVSSNTVSVNTVSDNQFQEGLSLSENIALSKPKWIADYQDPTEKKTIEQRQAERSSYQETMAQNQMDRQVLMSSTLDFSHMKIACVGDSITEGLEGQIPYPTYLKEILGAEEVYNLGIGGATYTSKVGDGAYPMSDRIDQVPEDTDLIIVLAGTNDNFFQKDWQFGFMDWESKGDGTFCGGVQLVMRRIKWIRPNSNALFFTPPSNSRVDELKAETPGLQDFKKYAEAVAYIGREEGFQTVDLYNQNFMNSHDADIQSNYMADKVHPNSEGGRMLAERIAAEIIKRYQ